MGELSIFCGSGKSSCCFGAFVNSNLFKFTGYDCSRWFVVNEKAGRGPHSNLLIARNYAKKTEVEKRKCTVGGILKGVAPVLEDLFTKKRDYLVKYNGQRVHADQLAGKMVILFFVPLVPIPLHTSTRLISLVDTYNYLLPTNNFEVVFIPFSSRRKTYGFGKIKVEPSKHFEELFSRMPWTAIPYTDIRARRRLQKKYVYDFYDTIIIIDTNGNVLKNCEYYLFKYGAEGYPFTNRKLLSLKSQDDAIAKQPSLGALLASPERDYVISNKGDKVPIHTLEEKVVALYFYEDGFTDWLTEELKTAYEELKKNKESFEVVLIYMYDTRHTHDHTDEGSFWEKFKTMPWLALPFRDPSYRKLMRLFNYPHVDWDDDNEATTLVIVGPRGKFIEPWGMVSSKHNNIQAFPFTREKYVQLYTEKVKELKLKMLWSPNTVFRGKNETKVQISQLAGKRIILFFEGKNKLGCCDAEFLKELKEVYLKMKGTDDEFEVIYISYSEKESCYAKHVEDVSWLVSPATELLPADYRLYCCFCLDILLRADSGSADSGSCLPGQCHECSSILAFDVDGRVVRKSIYPTIEHMDFPFYAGTMEEEAYFNYCDFFYYNTISYDGLQRDSYSDGNSYITRAAWVR